MQLTSVSLFAHFAVKSCEKHHGQFSSSTGDADTVARFAEEERHEALVDIMVRLGRSFSASH